MRVPGVRRHAPRRRSATPRSPLRVSSLGCWRCWRRGPPRRTGRRRCPAPAPATARRRSSGAARRRGGGASSAPARPSSRPMSAATRPSGARPWRRRPTSEAPRAWRACAGDDLAGRMLGASGFDRNTFWVRVPAGSSGGAALGRICLAVAGRPGAVGPKNQCGGANPEHSPGGAAGGADPKCGGTGGCHAAARALSNRRPGSGGLDYGCG